MSGQSESLSILHVDDEPDFVDMAATFLEREDDRISVESAEDAEEGLARLGSTDIDCIVSDYDMPVTNGLEFLRAVREDYSELPFILFTGKGSEEIASEAISAGVSDYLQKGGAEVYRVLANRIKNAVEQYQTRRELIRFKLAVEHAGHAIYMTDLEGIITYVNQAFEEVTGYSEPDAVGKTPSILKSGEQDAEYYQRLWETISNGDVWFEEIVNRRSDGALYSAIQTIAPIKIPGEGLDGYVAVQQPVSEGWSQISR